MTEETKGKRVTNHNGTAAGTDSDMVKFAFSGSPTDLFELAPEAGAVYVMTITAQCTNGTHKRLTRDGTQLVAGWAVREVAIGRQSTLADNSDQMTIYDELDTDVEAADQAEEDEHTAEVASISGVADPFNPDGAAPTSE